MITVTALSLTAEQAPSSRYIKTGTVSVMFKKDGALPVFPMLLHVELEEGQSIPANEVKQCQVFVRVQEVYKRHDGAPVVAHEIVLKCSKSRYVVKGLLFSPG